MGLPPKGQLLAASLMLGCMAMDPAQYHLAAPSGPRPKSIPKWEREDRKKLKKIARKSKKRNRK